jgi:hypothetical protein
MLLQKQAQCNVVNPRTRQPYTMDELFAEIFCSSMARAKPTAQPASLPQRGTAWSSCLCAALVWGLRLFLPQVQELPQVKVIRLSVKMVRVGIGI